MTQSSSGGSQYALGIMGLGMIFLGIVMMVWNSFTEGAKLNKPTPPTNNSSVTENGAKEKGKMSSVAYVLIGAGVAFMLLALYMSFYNRRKRRRRSVESAEDLNRDPSAGPQSQEESPEALNRRHDVPTYEEVMGNDCTEREGQGIERDARISMSLPSYESLVEVGLEEEPSSATAHPVPSNPEEQPVRQNSKSRRKIRSLKVHRIKSDKLHLKDFRIKMAEKTGQGRVVIEPLTPPPQYEDAAKNPFEDVQHA